MKENSEEKSSIESCWWKWKTIMAKAFSKWPLRRRTTGRLYLGYVFAPGYFSLARLMLSHMPLILVDDGELQDKAVNWSPQQLTLYRLSDRSSYRYYDFPAVVLILLTSNFHHGFCQWPFVLTKTRL